MINRKIYSIVTGIWLLLCSAMALAQPATTVGILSDRTDTAELEGMGAALRAQGFSTSVISWQQLPGVLKQGAIKSLWIHSTDSSFIATHAAGELTAAIRSFVEKGGRLFLSMEAFPLLHVWGFEPIAPQLETDTVKDEGFGRPLGFHGFKVHPLFAGLSGGVYTSKRQQDHPTRKYGYFGNMVPAGKVAGIQWTYITFTEDKKLLLEYQLGKGCVIAAGSYLYYTGKNVNRKQLELFTGNVFRYMAAAPAPDTQYWWYKEQEISTGRIATGRKPMPAAVRWPLPAPVLQETAGNAGPSFYDLVGRKILWMGKLNGGADEIWMHPFMALRDLQAGVQLKGEDTVRWLPAVPATVQVTPEYLVREYRILDNVIKEIYTVAFDAPLGMAHLEWEGSGIEKIAYRYASSLRYMWPYSHKATGSIRLNYDAAFRAHIFTAQQGALNTAVAYSAPPVSQQMTTNPALNQAQVQLLFAAPAAAAFDLYVGGSSASTADALAILDRQRRQPGRLYQQAGAYYKKLLDSNLVFETPDTLFNRGYRWALARTDQFLQTTPGIGTSLMAGFGTTARGWNGRHAISGRPGYAWYFGRDAQWSAMAIDGYGDHRQVKEVLRTFVRFQDLDGKIYHELTSSGVAHYDASDATPLFIILATHYLRHSGDTGFIREIWPALQKALQFCYSTDTDGDGLIENTNVGHGWIEGGPLFGTHTEFYLAGCWAAALEGMAYMTEATGRPAADLHRQAKQVKQLIDRDFWDKDRQYFYNGKYADGTYMQQSTGFATVPIYLGAVTDPQKAFAVTRRITGSRFSTDWGIRMLEEDNPLYHPGSYHAGMVWPLYSGWGALSAFPNGLYKAGYQYIMNSLLVYQDWALGSIEETLNGELYKPNGVCSHQCWSETMVLQPAIEGMLGFAPDALHDSLQLAPYFPWDWPFATVRNIRMGRHMLDLHMKRAAGHTDWRFVTGSALNIHFAPAFPPGTKPEKLLYNGKAIPFTIKEEADGIRLIADLRIDAGGGTLQAITQGGIGVLPVVTKAMPNQPSGGLKILSEQLEATTATWLAEGRPGSTYRFRVFSAQPIRSVSPARIVERSGQLTTIEVLFPASPERYSQLLITASL